MILSLEYVDKLCCVGEMLGASHRMKIASRTKVCSAWLTLVVICEGEMNVWGDIKE